VEEFMKHASKATAVALALGLVTAATGTADAATPPDETARLVETLLQRSEALSGRPLEPAFRRTAARALAALPAPDLEARAAAGRGITPLALGDTSKQMLYTPVPPCRLIDTRQAGGPLAAGSGRDFRVSGTGLQTQGGNPAGCNVPHGPATSAIINFVVISPVGPGNLRAWAYSEPAMPPPGASILNYPFGLTLANAVAVPICDVAVTNCPFDLKVQADVSGAHLVADVVGYFERFPQELVKNVSAFAISSTPVLVGTSCTNVTGLQVSVAAPVPGKVIVRASLDVGFAHTEGTADSLRAHIGQTATDCTSPFVLQALSAPAASANYHMVTPVTASFEVSPGTYTYFANVQMFAGAGNDSVNCCGDSSTLEAVFIPN
jgi:hypothetical protein